MKPLGDFTLREIKQRCLEASCCRECSLYDPINIVHCYLKRDPQNWPIQRLLYPATLTSNEIARARVLRDTIRAVAIYREGDRVLVKTADGNIVPTIPGKFPSLADGDTVEVRNL